jgi:hypothetical protein
MAARWAGNFSAGGDRRAEKFQPAISSGPTMAEDVKTEPAGADPRNFT